MVCLGRKNVLLSSLKLDLKMWLQAFKLLGLSRNSPNSGTIIAWDAAITLDAREEI